jgi:hypothetical protein
MFMATTGYALLLRDNVTYLRGDPQTYESIKTLAGSGLVLSLALGYAF